MVQPLILIYILIKIELLPFFLSISKTTYTTPDCQIDDLFLKLLLHTHTHTHTRANEWVFVVYMPIISGMINLFWIISYQLGNSSLGEANSYQKSLFSCSSLSWSWNHWDSPFHVNMFIDIAIIQILFRQPYCWNIMGIFSLTFLEDTISRQPSWFSGSKTFSLFVF